MRHGSLFSGIGGFDLASEWMGWENVFHCEWNEFGQKILKHYWPESISYGDITKTDFTIHRGQIDILTGGFPCQPYSMAGKRKGKADERHLWPEMLRAIREIQPGWIVGENVPGIINWSGGLVFHEVQTDLEAQGYEVFPVVLPACGVNAPHRRDRVWFVAHSINGGHRTERGENGKENRIQGKVRETLYAGMPYGTNSGTIADNNSTWSRSEHEFCSGRNLSEEWVKEARTSPDTTRSSSEGELLNRQGKGESGRCSGKTITNTNTEGLQGRQFNETSNPGRTERKGENKRQSHKSVSQFCKGTNWIDFPTQPPLCSRYDGISSRLDGITFPKWRNESIKGYGNAIVPQVVFQIFKAIASIHE